MGWGGVGWASLVFSIISHRSQPGVHVQPQRGDCTICTCSECESLSESLWPSPQALPKVFKPLHQSCWQKQEEISLQPLLWPLGETWMFLQMWKADQHHFRPQSPSQELRNIIFLSDFPKVITAASFCSSLWWQGGEVSLCLRGKQMCGALQFVNTFNSSVHTMKGP